MREDRAVAGESTDAAEFKQRIEQVYRAHTGSVSAHGAQSWFAAQVGVDPVTVYRWVSGRRKPGGPTIAVLGALELLAERGQD